MNKHLTRLATFLAAGFMMAGSASGGVLEGTRTIHLTTEDGNAIAIAEIAFTPGDDAISYKIDWADDVFADHFLSMRPFKCLESAAKHWCRVPYP